MAGKRDRKNYTLEDRKKYMDEWVRQGQPPATRFAKDQGLTASMFNRWLQLAGLKPVPKGGMTGGTPPHLRNAPTAGRTHKSVEQIRAALFDVYGPPRMHQTQAAKKHKCNKSSFSLWRTKRAELMPSGHAEVVPGLFNQLDGKAMPLKALPPPSNGHSPNGLELELGDAQQAAAGLFEQSQSDAWSELMVQLEPLPPRARLRVLTLIDKIQT